MLRFIESRFPGMDYFDWTVLIFGSALVLFLAFAIWYEARQRRLSRVPAIREERALAQQVELDATGLLVTAVAVARAEVAQPEVMATIKPAVTKTLQTRLQPLPSPLRKKVWAVVLGAARDGRSTAFRIAAREIDALAAMHPHQIILLRLATEFAGYAEDMTRIKSFLALCDEDGLL